MALVKKIWDFLNTDITKLFKREYSIKFFRRDDIGKGVCEAKRYDKKTGSEVSYDSPVYLQTVHRKYLPCD